MPCSLAFGAKAVRAVGCFWEGTAVTMAEEAGVIALRAELYACRRSRDQARAPSEREHIKQSGRGSFAGAYAVCKAAV